MDCFEVVREFVEDGIVLSGRTVGRGGLMTALGGLCTGGIGAGIDLGTVMQSYGENNLVSILFGEVPGVVIEISSSDFDYVDAELLAAYQTNYFWARTSPTTLSDIRKEIL